jgi:hypothetical protein
LKDCLSTRPGTSRRTWRQGIGDAAVHAGSDGSTTTGDCGSRGIELRSTDPAIDIETHDSDGPSYLFGGALLGDVIAGRRMLSDLSESLAGADVRHRIELYEASSEHPSHLWVHAWPEGKA